MEYFEIEGGHPLKGEIICQGAKNEALQIISAVLLSEDTVTISNIPDIIDVNGLIGILELLGVKVERKKADTYSFNAKDVDPKAMLSDEYRDQASRLRGSLMLLGPMLSRFGEAYISRPGGDKIGRRRIDTHIRGFEALGASFSQDKNSTFFRLHANGGLKGTFMHLDEPSVTGTANIIMAAALAKGTTTIYYAACEPYIQQLCRLINAMGGKISGVGSNLLTIEGVKSLGKAEHRIQPDMIEVGSFIGMAASVPDSQILIKDCNHDHLGLIPSVFEKIGVDLEMKGKDILVNGLFTPVIETFLDGSILTVYDNPWPGFTPDLLSILLVTAIQAKGSVLIHQKMFESRLFFVDKLIDMGAQIILCDPHRATVIGMGREQRLRGITMSSPDIRAGVSLLIAAMSAEGTSRIFNIEQIDRGYQDIENRLKKVGAHITRKTK